MIQMSMLFAGIATLLQTVGIGPVGARLPIVQGTSFAFLPVMIPIVALLLLQLPMAVAMTKRAGPAMLAFIVLGAIRAVYRAVGMWHGVIDRVTSFVMASGRKP